MNYPPAPTPKLFHFLSLREAATELGIQEKATEKNDTELNPNFLII